MSNQFLQPRSWLLAEMHSTLLGLTQDPNKTLPLKKKKAFSKGEEEKSKLQYECETEAVFGEAFLHLSSFLVVLALLVM